MKKPQNRRGASASADPEARTRLIRRLVILAAVALVGVFAGFLWRAFQRQSLQDKWDVLAALREKHEPRQDPIWNNPYRVYNPERLRYIAALEKFLDAEAEKTDGALAPQTRFLIAKTIADHLLANPGILDQKERSDFYAKAVAQLEAIHEDHPDFPLNWTMLSEDGFPSLTTRFIQWLKDNQQWEKGHLLRPRDLPAGPRVLIRTERGDIYMGLYSDVAPERSATFLERARAGHYDGTYFVEKRKIGDATEPGEYSVRASGTASRGLQPFDLEGHLAAAKQKADARLLPEESRNLMPLDRGLVAAWHPPEEENYENGEQLLFVVQRSPYLDYKFTPIGKLLDEKGFTSLATLDRIFGGLVWRDDKEVAKDSKKLDVLDRFQEPVRIVKMLVYEDGKLQEPKNPSPSRAQVAETERSLGTVKVDRYAKEPAAPPKKKAADSKGGSPKDGSPKDGKAAAGKDAPGKDAPGKDAPGKDAPGKDAPGKDDSGKRPAGKDAPKDGGAPSR
jgi:cyclophilin family peptidyl-prolyl cis-trans isomerase